MYYGIDLRITAYDVPDTVLVYCAVVLGMCAAFTTILVPRSMIDPGGHRRHRFTTTRTSLEDKEELLCYAERLVSKKLTVRYCVSEIISLRETKA